MVYILAGRRQGRATICTPIMQWPHAFHFSAREHGWCEWLICVWRTAAFSLLLLLFSFHHCRLRYRCRRRVLFVMARFKRQQYKIFSSSSSNNNNTNNNKKKSEKIQSWWILLAHRVKYILNGCSIRIDGHEHVFHLDILFVWFFSILFNFYFA